MRRYSPVQILVVHDSSKASEAGQIDQNEIPVSSRIIITPTRIGTTLRETALELNVTTCLAKLLCHAEVLRDLASDNLRGTNWRWCIAAATNEARDSFGKRRDQ